MASVYSSSLYTCFTTWRNNKCTWHLVALWPLFGLNLWENSWAIYTHEDPCLVHCPVLKCMRSLISKRNHRTHKRWFCPWELSGSCGSHQCSAAPGGLNSSWQPGKLSWYLNVSVRLPRSDRRLRRVHTSTIDPRSILTDRSHKLSYWNTTMERQSLWVLFLGPPLNQPAAYLELKMPSQSVCSAPSSSCGLLGMDGKMVAIFSLNSDSWNKTRRTGWGGHRPEEHTQHQGERDTLNGSRSNVINR